MSGTAVVDHSLQARLARLAQIEVVLQQQPQQLETLGLDVLLQLEVLQAGRPISGKETADLVELGG